MCLIIKCRSCRILAKCQQKCLCHNVTLMYLDSGLCILLLPAYLLHSIIILAGVPTLFLIFVFFVFFALRLLGSFCSCSSCPSCKTSLKERCVQVDITTSFFVIPVYALPYAIRSCGDCDLMFYLLFQSWSCFFTNLHIN